MTTSADPAAFSNRTCSTTQRGYVLERLTSLEHSFMELRFQIATVTSSLPSFATKSDVIGLPTQHDVNGLREGLKDLRGGMSAHSAEVTALRTDVTAVRTDAAVARADFAATRSDTAGLKADVSSLKSDMAGLKSNFGEIGLHYAIRDIVTREIAASQLTMVKWFIHTAIAILGILLAIAFGLAR